MKALGWVLVAAALLPATLACAEGLAFAAHHSWIPAFEHVFGEICHHLPERTLALGGQLLPVCARCTGLWLGAAVIGILALALPLRRETVGRALLASVLVTGLALLAAAVEIGGLVHPANGLRVWLGTGLGAVPPTIAGIGGRLLVRGSLDG